MGRRPNEICPGESASPTAGKRDGRTYAAKHERTEERSGHRNGYRKRDLHTKVGTLELRVPHDREGNFSSEIFEKHQRSEKVLILALQ
ncbi:transposase [Candidatus Bipolaricaulota bacterium]|nr:transposase [Candidatus Bipolaricaulota bacterium]MBS3791570.1 transposase [Candidatus Bipolaricaulota bacterium]